MRQKTILVLVGGCSTEHDISLQSAQGVLEHMDRSRWLPLMVGITCQGEWLCYNGPVSAIGDGSWEQDRSHCTPCTLSLDRDKHQLLLLGDRVSRVSFDGAFPILHGKNGEDGTVQGLLELAGIPFAGCGALSSALCMDKDRSHRLAALAGVSSPKGLVFAAGADRADIQAAADTLGYPLFVKPVRSGSSFGISRVTEPGAFTDAVYAALLYDTQVLVEKEVPGFEVGCAVMGRHTLMTGEPDEIELSGGFFDFQEKYGLISSKIHVPARVSREKADQIKESAKKIYRALGCAGFARVDMFLTPAGEIIFNEVNTIPGFTPHSRFPAMMGAAGISFTQLIDLAIKEAEAE